MHWLIGTHAFLGEIGALASLWIFVEFLFPHRDELKMCKKAGFISFVTLTLSWIFGGYYYLTQYGPHMKPIVKASSMPWAHLVSMELKEHVFLFLPFLSFLLYRYLNQISMDEMKLHRNKIVMLSLVITLISFSMAFMGYIVSTAVRLGLGG